MTTTIDEFKTVSPNLDIELTITLPPIYELTLYTSVSAVAVVKTLL